MENHELKIFRGDSGRRRGTVSGLKSRNTDTALVTVSGHGCPETTSIYLSRCFGNLLPKPAIALFMGLILISSAVFGAKTLGPLDMTEEEVRTKEVAIGSLAADAIRASAKTDAAIIPAAAFKKASIPAGEVTSQMLIAALTFPDDTISILELTGKDIIAALEKSVSIFPQKNLGFLQISGVEFSFDPALPSSKRVLSVKLGNKPLQDNVTYKVATSSSLANGALGYWRIWNKEQIRQKTNVTLGKAIESFLAATPTLDYRRTDRIIARG